MGRHQAFRAGIASVGAGVASRSGSFALVGARIARRLVGLFGQPRRDDRCDDAQHESFREWLARYDRSHDGAYEREQHGRPHYGGRE